MDMQVEARGSVVEIVIDGQARTLRPSDAEGLGQSLIAAADAAHREHQRRIVEEIQETRERYSLELGVAGDEHRVCALEAGPFETSAAAIAFAMEVKGMFAFQVKALSERITEWYDVKPDDPEALRPIVGATLNVFTDRDGTLHNIDLY